MLLGAVHWRLDRLEMDDSTMTDLTTLPFISPLRLCFLGGLVIGYGYFRALAMTANLIVGGGTALRAWP